MALPGLAESIDAILDAMVAALEAERESGSGGELDEVETIVRGERARPMPKLPALWVVPDPAKNDQTTQGLAESWSMAIHLASLVKDDDQDAGRRLAVSIAARARAIVMRDRRLGAGLPYVNDIVSTSFDPFGERGPENRVLHWSDAVVTVTWRTGGGA